MYLQAKNCVECTAGYRRKTRRFVFILMFLFSGFWAVAPLSAKETANIGILMANESRRDAVEGFKAGMASFAAYGEYDFVYTVLDAKNDRDRLPAMAEKIISGEPAVAIAAGGIEADALMGAAKGTKTPVVFLSVSSSIDRGLSSTMATPDKNATGIETNDTNLTAKRIWFIKRLLPDTQTIVCFHMPTIVPSVESIKVARRKAGELGMTLLVSEVANQADIQRETQRLSKDTAKVILMNPVAVIHGYLKQIIFPNAMAKGIPIFGYGMECIKKGAFASYASSRHENGKQAARLAYKIVKGALPKDIPIETPEKYEFIINRRMVEALSLELPDRAWEMADKIVELEF